MRRILWQRGDLTIYSYPAMLYLGLVLGTFGQLIAANRIHLSPARTLAATTILLIPALAGARLLFVAVHWRHYRADLRGMWRRSEGGAAMYGGLLLALPLSVAVLAVLRLPFGAFWDSASFTILIGMLFTRVGCFLNGCCAGRATDGPFGLLLPDHRGVWKRRIPMQLFEGIWTLLVLLGAIAVWPRLDFAGGLFLYTVAMYSIGRIVLEPAREERDMLFGFSLHRALSVVFVAASLLAFAIARVW